MVAAFLTLCYSKFAIDHNQVIHSVDSFQKFHLIQTDSRNPTCLTNTNEVKDNKNIPKIQNDT